eukprot:985027-Alexandrium_andersonii.AAC.1
MSSRTAEAVWSEAGSRRSCQWHRQVALLTLVALPLSVRSSPAARAVCRPEAPPAPQRLQAT